MRTVKGPPSAFPHFQRGLPVVHSPLANRRTRVQPCEVSVPPPPDRPGGKQNDPRFCRRPKPSPPKQIPIFCFLSRLGLLGRAGCAPWIDIGPTRPPSFARFFESLWRALAGTVLREVPCSLLGRPFTCIDNSNNPPTVSTRHVYFRAFFFFFSAVSVIIRPRSPASPGVDCKRCAVSKIAGRRFSWRPLERRKNGVAGSLLQIVSNTALKPPAPAGLLGKNASQAGRSLGIRPPSRPRCRTKSNRIAFLNPPADHASPRCGSPPRVISVRILTARQSPIPRQLLITIRL